MILNHYFLKNMTMKNLFQRPILFLLALLMAGAFGLSSCKDDEGDPVEVVDKAALVTAINAAKTMLDNTTEGNNDGEYPAAARSALQNAITAAEAVNTSTTVTQTQVNNAIVSLQQAVTTYEGAVITPIAEADLIGHWSFNEGSGTTAGDNSANGFDGTFKTGPAAWGAGTPEWVEDRHGEAGKALYFNEGANIEVPYNTALNPPQMSIALWVNSEEINANNRFMGMHSWNGYKFQLQEANKPFFTVNTQEGIYDRDAEVNGLPLNEWHHIAVTFGGGNMVFYIDGTEVKRWENTPGEARSIAGSPYNLVFGQDFPTDQYAATPDNYDNDQKIPLEWGGYFRGAMDEIRMYKTVLSASQIQSIYDREKPE
jgi:hypothetical protein